MFFKLFKKEKSTSETKPKHDIETGLEKTRFSLSSMLGRIFGKSIDPNTLASIKSMLIRADVGLETTKFILEKLKTHSHNDALIALKDVLMDLLPSPEKHENNPHEKPKSILLLGINGAGKTTTAGRLAHHMAQQNKTVLLASGDTFRAAATEQLIAWAEKTHTDIFYKNPGADSASVIFEAFEKAKASNKDILIADTAGRLHNKTNLMEELGKISRVLNKVGPNSEHDRWLVLDATVGQNGLQQALSFNETVGLTGIILTKLDGTAKGGIVFAISKILKCPILFLGVGEGTDDLVPFDREQFVESFLKPTTIPEAS